MKKQLKQTQLRKRMHFSFNVKNVTDEKTPAPKLDFPPDFFFKYKFWPLKQLDEVMRIIAHLNKNNIWKYFIDYCYYFNSNLAWAL